MENPLDEQLQAATGLFQQMNDRKIAADPAVFTMFGIMLGALKARRHLAECSKCRGMADAALISEADLTAIQQRCTDDRMRAVAELAADGSAVVLRLITAVRSARRDRDEAIQDRTQMVELTSQLRRPLEVAVADLTAERDAARKERDELGAEIRRMCGTMTAEDIHTEERHRSELDRVEATVESRTAVAIADWASDEFDIGRNPHEQKILLVEGIRNFLWKEKP